MADEIIIETTSAEVIEVGVVGPQGPAGAAGSGLETLTTKGDTLYRGETTGERLAIGTTGQVLKVSAQGLPTWANESGAVTSVNGATGAVTVAAATHAVEHEFDGADPLQAKAALVTTDVAALNGVYFWDGTTTSGRPNFFRTGTRKNTKIVYNSGTNQWNLVRNLTVEAVGVDGPSTVPWGNTWEDFVTPTSVAVTQLPLETMVQKLAETGGAATATTSEDGLMSSSDKAKLNGISALAEVNVQANWTEADSGSDAFIQNKPSTFAPSAHAAAHAAGGSDPLTPAAIGAMYALETRTNDFYSTSTYVLAQGRNVQLNSSVFGSAAAGTITLPRLTTDSAQNGDDLVVVVGNVASGGSVVIERYIWTGSSYINSKESVVNTTVAGSWRFRLLSGVWTLLPVMTHEHAASDITSGTLDIARIPTGTGSTQVALGNHSHELTALAATGATNGHVLTANGSGGVTFAAASGGGVTGAASSASDVLGVSGANIIGVDANADRIIFFDDSAGKLTHLTVGSGLSISDTTITATASGGSKTYAVFAAEHNQPPSTAFATLDTRNSIAVLDFDAATDESAVFVGIMPEAASLGSGLIVRLHWMATSATSGNVRWGVQFERSNTDLDADSFDTAVEATAAANGTSGILTTTAITVTTIDGITAGDVFRLKVFRNADDATNDTMTGDAELVAVEVRSAA